ncbi:MAG: BatA domain-containing protein [Bacteroidales bacterium]|nr:BatA domain-containing protein [Bacteroidales bacterium]
MSFLYPSFFWALILISVPIIIHLFNFRIYKTVYFSNIRFLQNIKDVSESKSRLKNLIILILRILTIAALVVAFARPFVPIIQKQDASGESIVSIYLDNSFSMNAGSLHGNLFDAAKERARLLTSAYDNRQKFLFLTNDFSAKHRIITNKQQIQQFISDCNLSATTRKFSEVINYRKNFLKSEHKDADFQHIFYIISDFQKSVCDLNNFVTDSNTITYFLPLATSKVNNIYIDSCWFASPGRNLNKQEELMVRLVNKGSEAYQDIPINLNIKGKQKAVNSFDIEPDATKIISINYTNTETGLLPSVLEITDYPITYDNKFYFSYQIKSHISILVINNSAENKYINSLFKSDSTFRIANVNAGGIRTSEFFQYQLIILDGLESYASGLVDELKRFVANGGVLLCIPGENIRLSEYNYLLQQLEVGILQAADNQLTYIGKINYDHFIYKDVFLKKEDKIKLPEIKNSYPMVLGNASSNRILLSSVANKPLLVQNNYLKGKVYTFAFSLLPQNSDFVLHPLFVPTLFNIAAYSQNDEQLYYTTGKAQLIDVNLQQADNEKPIRIVDSENRTDFIPKQSGIGERGLRLNMMDNIVFADNYFILDVQDTLLTISFNYNRDESDPDYYLNNELLELVDKHGLKNIKLLPAAINELEIQVEDSLKERKDMWKIFVILALVFLISEILVIRLWKD